MMDRRRMAREYRMNKVLKRVLIAAALVTVCAVILAATKRYGVWIITGIAPSFLSWGSSGRTMLPAREETSRTIPKYLDFAFRSAYKQK